MASDVLIPATVTTSEQLGKPVKDSWQSFPISYVLMGALKESMGDRLVRLRAIKGWSLAVPALKRRHIAAVRQ